MSLSFLYIGICRIGKCHSGICPLVCTAVPSKIFSNILDYPLQSVYKYVILYSEIKRATESQKVSNL